MAATLADTVPNEVEHKHSNDEKNRQYQVVETSLQLTGLQSLRKFHHLGRYVDHCVLHRWGAIREIEYHTFPALQQLAIPGREGWGVRADISQTPVGCSPPVVHCSRSVARGYLSPGAAMDGTGAPLIDNFRYIDVVDVPLVTTEAYVLSYYTSVESL